VDLDSSRRFRDSTPRYHRLRWLTRRRFDPSCSPSATIARSMHCGPWDRPKIPQQSEPFRRIGLYWRFSSCGILGSETAFFSRASYFVILDGSEKSRGAALTLSADLLRFESLSNERELLGSKPIAVKVIFGGLG
jgi:hypothetical protein